MLRVAEMLMFVWLVGWFGYRAQNAGKSVVIGLLVGALAATITKISTVLAVNQWGEGLAYTSVWLRLMVSLLVIGVLCILGSQFYKLKDA